MYLRARRVSESAVRVVCQSSQTFIFPRFLRSSQVLSSSKNKSDALATDAQTQKVFAIREVASSFTMSLFTPIHGLMGGGLIGKWVMVEAFQASIVT